MSFLRARSSLIAVVLVGCLLLPACANKKVTKANFDQIKEGMTLADVEAILGKGEKESGGDGGGVAAQAGVAVGGVESMGSRPNSDASTFVWESRDKKITVYFFQGKMRNKTQSGL
jgi:hypothetical protein